MASEKEIVVLSVNEPEVSNVDLDKAFEKHFEALNSTDDVVKRCQMNNQFIKSYWDLYDDQVCFHGSASSVSSNFFPQNLHKN